MAAKGRSKKNLYFFEKKEAMIGTLSHGDLREDSTAAAIAEKEGKKKGFLALEIVLSRGEKSEGRARQKGETGGKGRHVRPTI